MMQKAKLEVVVGILKKQDLYLFAKRPIGKPYANYWEFSGGKIEAQETKTFALKRELQEELGIYVSEQNMKFIFYTFHEYAHADVNLYFYLINQWDNEIISNENQELFWGNINNYPKPLLPSLENILTNLLI